MRTIHLPPFVTHRLNHFLRFAAGLLCILSFAVFPTGSYAQFEQVNSAETETQSPSEYAGLDSYNIAPRNPGFAGKPISLVSGAESFRRIDLTIGELFPITIKRRYTSNTGYESPL